MHFGWCINLKKKEKKKAFFLKITAYEGGGFSVDKFNYNGA